MLTRLSRSLPAIKASARLAGLYAAGVGLLLLPALYPFADLRSLPIQSVVLLGSLLTLGFLALALARRVGFVLLWAVLLGLWSVLLIHRPVLYAFQPFLGWSVLALPLAVLTRMGFPIPGGATAGRRRLDRGLLLVWLTSLGLALGLRHVSWDFNPPSYISVAFGYSLICLMPLPFLIGLAEVTRVIGTVRTSARLPATGDQSSLTTA